jgi:dihydroneopterin aldolase
MSRGIIRLHDVEIECIIGVYQEERLHPQTIFLDVVMEVDFSKCVQTDACEDTVDYSAVKVLCEEIALEGKFQLIEKLAYTAASSVKTRFPCFSVEVTVRKPAAQSSATWREGE